MIRGLFDSWLRAGGAATAVMSHVTAVNGTISLIDNLVWINR
jgi:hypothetical protein